MLTSPVGRPVGARSFGDSKIIAINSSILPC